MPGVKILAIEDQKPLLNKILEILHFEGFEAIELCDNLLTHSKVCCTLIVLKETLYRRLAQSIIYAPGPRLGVHFFQDLDAALSQAETIFTPPVNL